jgi:hypothetical protein
MAAVAIHPGRIRTTFSALKGDDIERRSDPRLLCLSRNMARHTVIFNIVAGKPREFGTPCRSVQLEPNPGGSDRQCVPLRDSY